MDRRDEEPSAVRATLLPAGGRGLPSGRWVVPLLFTSGAAALAGEVAWVRLLAGVFGTTSGAAAVVLACFMAGSGAGALVLGRLADRSRNALGLYGRLEIAAGVLALLVPLEVWLAGPVYGAVFRACLSTEATSAAGNLWVLTLARVALSSLALLPPAFAMGGALPALVRFVTGPAASAGGGQCTRPVVHDERRVGFNAGRLYAANTAGAVAGCLVAGYVLVRHLGVTGAALLAGTTSVAVGVLAVALSRRGGVTRGGPPATAPADLPRRWTVPALYAASGFAALGCEVLWTRALVFVLNATVYAFTSMLTVFLLGLAAGGAAGAFLARRVRRPALAFAALELAAAVAVALGLVVLRAFAAGWLSIDRALGSGWPLSAALHLAVAAGVMLVPTFLFGMIFPVVGRLNASRGVTSGATAGARGPATGPGGSTGEVLFANALGGALGALAAGFVLVPVAGTARSILLLACVNLFVAAAAVVFLTDVPRALGLRAAAAAALVAVALFAAVPRSALDSLFAAPNTNPRARLVHAREGPGGIVTVHRYPPAGGHERSGLLLMSVNGVSIAGTAPLLRTTQLLQGLIPSLLRGEGARVLQVGIGTGETSRTALALGAKRLTLVEISPEVVRATRRHFGQLAGAVLDDTRLRLVYADGKTFLRHARERYDLILSDSTYPFLSGSSGLYTLDYFTDCRRRLAPGGLVSAWLPLDIPARGLRSVLATFAEAFPHATLWTTSRGGYKHALMLGSERPIRLEYARLAALMKEPSVADLLARAGAASVEDLASSIMLGRDAMLACAAGAPLHTDDRPVLEYETQYRAGNVWRERLAANMAMLDRARVPLLKHAERAEHAERVERVEHVDLTGVPDAEREAVTRALERAGEEARRRTERLVAELRAFPHVNAAREAWGSGRREEAVRLYLEALEVDPDDAGTRSELGRLYIELGRVEEAMRYDPGAGPRRGDR